MNFRCNGLDLSDAVNKVLKATSTKTTSPILEGIKIEASGDLITLSATDLEIAIKKSVRADVAEEGVVVVPGKFFNDYIRKLTDEELSFLLNEKGQLKISYKDSEGYIQVLDSHEFPFLNDVNTDKKFTINANNLKSIINKTIFAVATDDSRPILKGELFEIKEKLLTVVALDGYRLAMANKPITNTSGEYKIIIPSRSLMEVSKLIENNDDEIEIFVSNNYIKFDLKDLVLTSRLIDGEFINYKQIIHNQFSTNITVDKEQLEDAIERASILSKIDRNNLVKFEIKDKNLTLTSNSEIGSIVENITICLTGEELVIAFNSRYFIEALRSSNDKFIKLNFTNNINPCIITPAETEEFLYLILPVRIV